MDGRTRTVSGEPRIAVLCDRTAWHLALRVRAQVGLEAEGIYHRHVCREKIKWCTGSRRLRGDVATPTAEDRVDRGYAIDGREDLNEGNGFH